MTTGPSLLIICFFLIFSNKIAKYSIIIWSCGCSMVLSCRKRFLEHNCSLKLLINVQLTMHNQRYCSSLSNWYPRLKSFKNQHCYLTSLWVLYSMTQHLKRTRRLRIDTWKQSAEISDPAYDTQNTLGVIDLPWPGQCGSDWPGMWREYGAVTIPVS